MAATQQKVFSKMQTIISDQLCVSVTDVELKASFTEDLGADSLDVVELIIAFEEAFNIRIPESVAATIENVEDALEFIMEEKNK